MFTPLKVRLGPDIEAAEYTTETLRCSKRTVCVAHENSLSELLCGDIYWPLIEPFLWLICYRKR